MGLCYTAVCCRSTKRLLLERYLSSYAGQLGGRKRSWILVKKTTSGKTQAVRVNDELIGTHGRATECTHRDPRLPQSQGMQSGVQGLSTSCGVVERADHHCGNDLVTHNGCSEEIVK